MKQFSKKNIEQKECSMLVASIISLSTRNMSSARSSQLLCFKRTQEKAKYDHCPAQGDNTYRGVVTSQEWIEKLCGIGLTRIEFWIRNENQMCPEVRPSFNIRNPSILDRFMKANIWWAWKPKIIPLKNWSVLLKKREANYALKFIYLILARKKYQ